MKRFLMLVAVAAVAGAMYVAASPASPQASGPTAKQFKALKKEVAALKKDETQVKKAAAAAVDYIAACFLNNTTTVSIAALPVSQFGSSTSGFLYGTPGGTPIARTALDVNATTPSEYLQEVNASCMTTAGSLLRGAVWAQHSR